MSTSLPELSCACATLRRAARLVTQLYGQEMGNTLEPTQYSLLTALKQHPGANQTRLGLALGLDKTTLSRSLRLMERNGWAAVGPSDDQRERGFVLTALGRSLLKASKPGWTRAQGGLRRHLASGELDQILKAVNRVAEVAAQSQRKEVSGSTEVARRAGR